MLKVDGFQKTSEDSLSTPCQTQDPLYHKYFYCRVPAFTDVFIHTRLQWSAHVSDYKLIRIVPITLIYSLYMRRDIEINGDKKIRLSHSHGFRFDRVISD